MGPHLIQELNVLADSLGPEFANCGLPCAAADALQELITALGSAKTVLINRHNSETDLWERMAALGKIDDVLGVSTVVHRGAARVLAAGADAEGHGPAPGPSPAWAETRDSCRARLRQDAGLGRVARAATGHAVGPTAALLAAGRPTALLKSIAAPAIRSRRRIQSKCVSRLAAVWSLHGAWGPLRVFLPGSGQDNGIALTRALGLARFKSAIGGTPEVARFARHEDDLFLVLASDGVFAVLTPEMVHHIIASSASAQHAAEAVIEAVLERGAPDNASVIVVDMR